MTRPKKQSKLSYLISSLGWKGWSLLGLFFGVYWWIFIYSPYPKTPIEIPFDIGKKGAVVETDFTIPYSFDFGHNYYEISIAFIDTKVGRHNEDILKMSESFVDSGERYFTTMERVVGVYGVSTEINQSNLYLKGIDLEVSLYLTPHDNVNSPITYTLGSEKGRWNRRQLSAASDSLNMVVNMAEYGPYASTLRSATVKPLIHIDPAAGDQYNLKIKSNVNAEIPEGINTYLIIRKGFKAK